MKSIGLSNAMTDVVVAVRDNDLESLKIKKGNYYPIKKIDKNKLERIVKGNSINIPGGSPANVIRNLSALGLETGLIFTIGNDKYGKEYARQLKKQNIENYGLKISGKSGVCYTLITPDGERTFVSSKGVSDMLDCNGKYLDDANLFHTSGYELNSNAVFTHFYFEIAKNKKMITSFDLADKTMVKKLKKDMLEMMPFIDVLFMTEEEALEFDKDSPENTQKQFCDSYDMCVVLKKGKEGSIVRKGKIQYKIPIVPVEVVNTNGAGDAYASGFLKKYLDGIDFMSCGYYGSEIASKVCSRNEPFLIK
ncbi:MAG: adenosine kinase [Candidatus Woesearchaeota archaeon]|jgi:sugar/nucleoside kinase (ribokinase family)